MDELSQKGFDNCSDFSIIIKYTFRESNRIKQTIASLLNSFVKALLQTLIAHPDTVHQ